MSSSPSRAAVSPPLPEVQPFAYGEVVARPANNPETGEHSPAPPESRGAAAVDLERQARAREMGRREGAQEAQEARGKFEAQLAEERGALARALAEFSRDRAVYYRRIEEEAVQLALAIARKVIHREAQVDPLLLMGIVRVALERIEGATGVALRVNPGQAAEWRAYLAAHLDPGDLPEIVEDAAVAVGQVGLRTAMGTAELGLEVQLKEIEQGLMDLLAARPGEKS